MSLLTGRVSAEGDFPQDRQVSDLAIAPGQLRPELSYPGGSIAVS